MIRTTVVGGQPINAPPILNRHGSFLQTADDLRFLLGEPGGIDRLEAMARQQIQSVIADQEAIGLDVLSEGEVTRPDYWSYFALSLEGTAITGTPPDRCGKSAEVTVSGPLGVGHRYMLDDWSTAQSCTHLPVKITIPGPLTCASYVKDAYYGSPELLSLAFARSINQYIHLLVEAGCRYVQIDDCQLVYQHDVARSYGMSHLGVCFENIGPEVTSILHICRGRPGFAKCYDGYGKAPDRNCYEVVLPLADQIPIHVISVEQAFYPSPVSVFEKLTSKTLMLGVVDVGSEQVESVDEIVERARSVLQFIDDERLILAPDCGFGCWRFGSGHPVPVAFQKLSNMVAAARRLNGTH